MANVRDVLRDDHVDGIGLDGEPARRRRGDLSIEVDQLIVVGPYDDLGCGEVPDLLVLDEPSRLAATSTGQPQADVPMPRSSQARTRNESSKASDTMCPKKPRARSPTPSSKSEADCREFLQQAPE